MVGLVRQILQRIPFGNVERGRLLSCIQALIALIFLVAVGVMSFVTVRYARSHAGKELVNRGAIVTSIVSRSAARAVSDPQEGTSEAALDKVVYDIRAEEGLEFAFITDRHRRILAHSDSQQKGRTLPAGLSDGQDIEARPTWGDEGFYYTTRELGSPGTPFAAGATLYEFVRTIPLTADASERHSGNLQLHMGFALPGFWSFAGTGVKRIVPGLLVAFLLLIMGNYLAGVLVRPLRALKEETAAAAKADDNWHLELEATGEIAEIARNWNEMVRNFRTSYERVVQTRRELEVRNRVMLYEKKRTEAIVESLADGVVVTDPSGKISFVNRECENLLGISRDSAVSALPSAVITDKAVLEFLEPLLGTAEAGGRTAGDGPSRRNQKRVVDVEVHRKSVARSIRITHLPIVDAAGKPGGGIFTFRDTTQEKLEERARKEFVSNVTHELRAPLTAIKSYVEMLIDDEARKPELQREFFNTINEEADRLARLIDDMLNMSKIEVGNLVLNKSLVRTRKLVEDAVNGMRSAAANKSIELTWNIAGDLPDVEADKEMVRVVVTNLLSNGIKYTQEGGKVFLSAELMPGAASQTAAGSIAVTVADNGPGIPEDELDKIFEKFYRGRDTQNRKVPGSGLGLAIAREIATLHGGDIKVSSTVGQGSKFTLLLPACEPSRKVS